MGSATLGIGIPATISVILDNQACSVNAEPIILVLVPFSWTTQRYAMPTRVVRTGSRTEIVQGIAGNRLHAPALLHREPRGCLQPQRRVSS